MEQTGTLLPIAGLEHRVSRIIPPSNAPRATGSNGNAPSFAEIAKLLEGGKHHAHAGDSSKSLFDQGSGDSGDAFGVASSGTSPSVDAFGAASSTPSSTASLASAISDPFSSLASNFQVQAQLNSQQILDL